MESGRKGRKVIRLGPVCLGGDSEEQGDFTGGEPPWGVSHGSHTLGATAQGFDARKTSPLGWLKGWWY